MAGVTAGTSVNANAIAYGAQELGREIEHLIQTPANDAFRLSVRERKILELWDGEEELRLEINVLNAQHDASRNNDSDISVLSDEQVQAELSKAERDLLTARSTYTIRQNLIRHVLIADPLLKSIHAAQAASPLERRLLPLVHERDVLSMVSSTLSSQLQVLRQRIALLEQENIDMLETNQALAGRMIALAEEAKTGQRIGDVRDARLRAELEALEREVVEKRKTWRMWKSIVGGMVARSGVDWESDERLLGAVMDEEDELG